MHLTIAELLAYTEEERAKWRRWFAERGDEHLVIALAGETHTSLGALILHCFWAEMWYARWMQGEVITEASEIYRQNQDVRADRATELFAFGLKARKELRAFADDATRDDWEREYQAASGDVVLRGTARKLIAHILVHEVRHFAQAAFAVRQHNLDPPGDHDLCFSQSFGPLITRSSDVKTNS